MAKKEIAVKGAVAGLIGLFGFAGGWAISREALSRTMPTDPNVEWYSLITGVGTGAVLATASSGWNLGWLPSAKKYM